MLDRDRCLGLLMGVLGARKQTRSPGAPPRGTCGSPFRSGPAEARGEDAVAQGDAEPGRGRSRPAHGRAGARARDDRPPAVTLRNQRLRESYLEVGKPGFDKAVLSEIRVGEARTVTFEGEDSFGGREAPRRDPRDRRQRRAQARSRRNAGAASFPLVLTDFGVEPPQYMGVGVGNRLIVKVTFLAAPAGAR